MKERRLTEQEIEHRDARIRRVARILLILFVASTLLTGKRREYTYKRVIYDYERSTNYAEQSADTTEVVKRVGKPNKPYWTLPRKPRYKHFWDLY